MKSTPFFNYKVLLSTIFLLSMILRFLYFPENIYFGFDQARDAYEALDIINGDLKIIGPTTSFVGLNHGVLYYYILAPLYFLGNSSPEFVAAALRILNASGVFLIFYLSSLLFSRRVGLLASLLYAISFEQTQFSIYMGNPSLAVLSIMLMYLGLALVIFARKNIGLPLAFLGLGFSMQFQFALLYLGLPFLLILIFFYKHFLKLSIKIYLLSVAALLFSFSTFIVAQFKFNFNTIHALLSLSNFNPDKNLFTILNTYIYMLSRMLSFNLVDHLLLKSVLGTVLVLALTFTVWKSQFRKQILFLCIWFFAIFATFAVHGGVKDLERDVPLYYTNIGVSVSLLIFIAFLIDKISLKRKFILIPILVFLIYSNFSMIGKLNPKGTISEINVQQGMLLSNQKKVLDFIYQESGDSQFAVKAITMPFDINTTWSYLFEWYGKDKYEYMPIWGGKNALGYHGNLEVEEAQDKLPAVRYVIIEPVRGIRQGLIDTFLTEEGYFTKLISERKIGQFVVQKREKY